MTGRDEAHAEVLDALHASLLDALDDRQPIPCRTPGRAPLWLSERRDDRDAAAEECGACPALDPCGAAGAFATFGVWGGRDRGPQRPKPPRVEPSPITEVTCPGCAGTFLPARRGQKFCTASCRWITTSNARRARLKGDA